MDKTFCASEVEKHGCGREITEEEKKHLKQIGSLMEDRLKSMESCDDDLF